MAVQVNKLGAITVPAPMSGAHYRMITTFSPVTGSALFYLVGQVAGDPGSSVGAAVTSDNSCDTPTPFPEPARCLAGLKFRGVATAANPDSNTAAKIQPVSTMAGWPTNPRLAITFHNEHAAVQCMALTPPSAYSLPQGTLYGFLAGADAPYIFCIDGLNASSVSTGYWGAKAYDGNTPAIIAQSDACPQVMDCYAGASADRIFALGDRASLIYARRTGERALPPVQAASLTVNWCTLRGRNTPVDRAYGLVTDGPMQEAYIVARLAGDTDTMTLLHYDVSGTPALIQDNQTITSQGNTALAIDTDRGYIYVAGTNGIQVLNRRGPVMPPRQFDELAQGAMSISVDSAARKLYCATPGKVLVLGQQD